MTEEEYYEEIYDNSNAYDTDDDYPGDGDWQDLWQESYKYHVNNLVDEE